MILNLCEIAIFKSIKTVQSDRVAQEKLPYDLRAPVHKKSPAKIRQSTLINMI
jgi:hypothetical protein